MRAVVEEGLKLGKHTAAHAHGAEGIKNAVKAGVRTIEHGTMADEEALVALAEAGAFLVPTMMLHTLFEDHAKKCRNSCLTKVGSWKAPKRFVLRAKELVVEIAMRTDAGTNYNYHGNNAAEIVHLVVNEVMSPSEALTCATLMLPGPFRWTIRRAVWSLVNWPISWCSKTIPWLISASWLKKIKSKRFTKAAIWYVEQ